jgi:hypothetical protein
MIINARRTPSNQQFWEEGGADTDADSSSAWDVRARYYVAISILLAHLDGHTTHFLIPLQEACPHLFKVTLGLYLFLF